MARFSRLSTGYLLTLCLTAAGWIALLSCSTQSSSKEVRTQKIWLAPDTSTIPRDEHGNLIRYGRDLVTRTYFYLGPLGTVRPISNGMNCQNCHLEAGTKLYGNHYGSASANYPRYRERSGKVESLEDRINDCLVRSLNGEPLDSLSKEMTAIVAYIRWLGKDIPRGTKAPGSGFLSIPFLERAANPVLGKKLFMTQCRVCHGSSGEGLRLVSDGPYIYPPLCGENSFTTAAGLFRLSNLAKYIRSNMPNGATFEKPILTDEEAWDIAAYVVSLPRPEKQIAHDWPIIETKPVDYPFGPYADGFSELQHKYGPYPPILEFKKVNRTP